jgi:putative addiction module component (TIGR02574 family)
MISLGCAESDFLQSRQAEGLEQRIPNSRIWAEMRRGIRTAAAYPIRVPTSEALIMETKLRQLTVDERIKLVEDLWDSIAADQGALPITADQKSELDRRLNAYAVDKNRGRPATHAVRDIRRQL